MAAFVAGGDFLPPQSETYGHRGAFGAETAAFFCDSLCDSPPSSLLIPIRDIRSERRLWSGSSGFSRDSLPLSSMILRAGAEATAKPGAVSTDPC